MSVSPVSVRAEWDYSARMKFYGMKGYIIMKNSKKIAAVMAFCIAVSVLCTACSGNADGGENITPNVITSADGSAEQENVPSDSGETQGESAGTQAPVETVVVTNAEGNAETGVNGDVLTAPAETTVPAETLSNEEIQNMMTTASTQAPVIVDPAVDSKTRYAYNTLTDDEKALYDAIVGAATSMNFKIRGTDNVSLEKWAKVYGMVYNQEPQIFWLHPKLKVGKLYFSESDAAKIAEMQKKIDAVADKLVDEASKMSSTYEKLKHFHDYLVYNSTFELAEDAYNQSIYNAFSGGTSTQGNIQCAGYARAMQYLCDKAGIDCMVITGENETGSTHAWNKVKVEGEWYNLDTTWDDPILSTPEYDYLRYNFFLVPDSWINEKTHFQINTKEFSSGGTYKYFDPPAATATAQNYFVKNGLVYNDVDSADKAIKAELDKAADAGLSVAHIMVGSKDVYDAITGKAKEYQNYVKEGRSNVKGISNGSCNPHALIVEFDVKYNG